MCVCVCATGRALSMRNSTASDLGMRDRVNTQLSVNNMTPNRGTDRHLTGDSVASKTAAWFTGSFTVHPCTLAPLLVVVALVAFLQGFKTGKKSSCRIECAAMPFRWKRTKEESWETTKSMAAKRSITVRPFPSFLLPLCSLSLSLFVCVCVCVCVSVCLLLLLLSLSLSPSLLFSLFSLFAIFLRIFLSRIRGHENLRHVHDPLCTVCNARYSIDEQANYAQIQEAGRPLSMQVGGSMPAVSSPLSKAPRSITPPPLHPVQGYAQGKRLPCSPFKDTHGVLVALSVHHCLTGPGRLSFGCVRVIAHRRVVYRGVPPCSLRSVQRRPPFKVLR